MAPPKSNTVWHPRPTGLTATNGEIDPTTLRHRLKDLRSQRLPTLTSTDLDPVRRVFEWHPSEASGLLLAAADGHRGYVQVRDAGDQIALTDDTASLHTLDLDEIGPHLPAAELVDTSSLSDAGSITERITGIKGRRKRRPAARVLAALRAAPPSSFDMSP